MVKTLRQKHLDAKSTNDTMMVLELFIHANKITFNRLNVDLVRKYAIRTEGLHRPSRLDADFSINILRNSNFGHVSDNLCHAIALLTRMLFSDELADPKY